MRDSRRLARRSAERVDEGRPQGERLSPKGEEAARSIVRSPERGHWSP